VLDVRTSFGGGGNFIDAGLVKSFSAPYDHANWPEAIDLFEHVVALRAGVVLHASPSRDTAQVATVVKNLRVAVADVYSPIGYRAGFSNRTGEWKLEALVAGD